MSVGFAVEPMDFGDRIHESCFVWVLVEENVGTRGRRELRHCNECVIVTIVELIGYHGYKVFLVVEIGSVFTPRRIDQKCYVCRVVATH